MANANNAARPMPQAETATIGDRFLKALAGRDFPALAACFAEETHFRALTPHALHTGEGVSEPTRYFQRWFGTAERIELLTSAVDPLGARQHLSWRFRVHEAAGRTLVEQQAFATIREGHITAIDVLCSGFLPEAAAVAEVDRTSQGLPFAVAAVLEGAGANCATLTPLIKTTLADLASGQVLEVITGEPSAGRDIASWCSLTGNSLLDTQEIGATQHFYVRKK